MTRRKTYILVSLFVALVMVFGIVLSANAVGGAAFTTFNAHVDGASKDVCKNSAINCNIYGAKEYVWLNGGPDANHLKPDGWYFFAVLVPGGQPNPNDGGPKNLSDDYDAYTNRTFRTEGGEVVEYTGSHWLDSGKKEIPPDVKPNGLPPYIRLFPYADTWNPGGVYILAICSLERGYPVEPRDCKYDAFKVKKGKMDYSFYLSGMKFEDIYADGVKDDTDPGLEGWKITIKGTGPDGSLIDEEVFTDEYGFWEYTSPVYSFIGNNTPLDVSLQVCEELQPGWTQSYPTPACYDLTFTPTGFDAFFDLDFGNWLPVEVTACKEDYWGNKIPGWEVSLTEDGEVVDTQYTGEDGCYTWTDLTPGIVYDVHEGSKDFWAPFGPVDWVFEKAVSGGEYGYTFINREMQWCSPGYWRQPQHLGSWLATEYAPSDKFFDVLGYYPTLSTKGQNDGATTDPTLWEVLQSPEWYGGDDFNAVGDLLSEAHPDIDFWDDQRVDNCPLGLNWGEYY